MVGSIGVPPSLIKEMKPNHTNIAPLTIDISLDSIFTIEQLRNFLGLFGDDTTDGLVFRLHEQAINTMEDMNTKALIPRQITDYYNCWNKYLELSQYGATDVSLEYFNSDGVSTPLTDYVLDTTGKYPRIYFRNTPNHMLSDLHKHPIVVSYTPVIPMNMIYAARNAIQFLVTRAYANRAMNLMPVDIKTAFKIYQKYRKRIG